MSQFEQLSSDSVWEIMDNPNIGKNVQIKIDEVSLSTSNSLYFPLQYWFENYVDLLFCIIHQLLIYFDVEPCLYTAIFKSKRKHLDIKIN
jgi:hypothetical protein